MAFPEGFCKPASLKLRRLLAGSANPAPAEDAAAVVKNAGLAGGDAVLRALEPDFGLGAVP